jgi:hypothetical protein
MPEPTSDEVARAEAMLSRVPEFAPLVGDGRPFWKTGEVAGLLGVTDHIVRGWCESGQIRGATKYDQNVGWRIPRSGLLVFLATRQSGQQAI